MFFSNDDRLVVEYREKNCYISLAFFQKAIEPQEDISGASIGWDWSVGGLGSFNYGVSTWNVFGGSDPFAYFDKSLIGGWGSFSGSGFVSPNLSGNWSNDTLWGSNIFNWPY